MKAEYVNKVYSVHARFYELTHRMIFRGWDASWRQYAAWLSGIHDGANVIDICTGQGHAASEYLKVWDYSGIKNVKITGVDMNERMLEEGRRRLSTAQGEDRIKLVRADVMNMCPGKAASGFASFDDSSFDAALCVFGIGGIENPEKAFIEMLRIVKPGGSIVVVDTILPSPCLHTPGRAPGLWERFRKFIMRRIWGWENFADINEALERTTYTDAEQAEYFLDTVVKALCPMPRLLLKKTITTYAGIKKPVDDNA